MQHLGEVSLLISFFLGVIIAIALVLFYLLSVNKVLKKASNFLLILLIILILHSFTYLFFISKLILVIPYFLGVSYSLLFLIGCSYFFFVKSYFEDKFTLQIKHLLHLLPLIIILWIQFPIFTASSEYKAQLINYIYDFIPVSNFKLSTVLKDNFHATLILIYGIYSFSYLT